MRKDTNDLISEIGVKDRKMYHVRINTQESFLKYTKNLLNYSAMYWIDKSLPIHNV